MSYAESAAQMLQAYHDVCNGTFALQVTDACEDFDLFLAEPNKQEQPRVPGNKMWFSDLRPDSQGRQERKEDKKNTT